LSKIVMDLALCGAGALPPPGHSAIVVRLTVAYCTELFMNLLVTPAYYLM